MKVVITVDRDEDPMWAVESPFIPGRVNAEL
jgi:hypothetical protein